MEQARYRWRIEAVVVVEGDELDWSPEPSLDDSKPLPLVRRRASPRPRTLAGVGGPIAGRAASTEADDLLW